MKVFSDFAREPDLLQRNHAVNGLMGVFCGGDSGKSRWSMPRYVNLEFLELLRQMLTWKSLLKSYVSNHPPEKGPKLKLADV